MRFSRFARVGVPVLVLTGLLVAGLPVNSKKKPAAAEADQDADQFMVVDCLLPGQVKKLGRRMTYVTPRRPIRTTTSDCEIRGGEYVGYDRADYATSLKIWLEAAKEGDAKAQTYVGEIFEKGLGAMPDPAAAAEWYRRAADQGYSEAQVNLGHLYEKGLGVDRDPREALRWYRSAAGLPANAILLDDSGDGGQARAGAEVARLETEVAGLRNRVGELERESLAARAELDTARKQEQALAAELTTGRSELEKLRKRQGSSDTASQAEIAQLEERLRQREADLGRHQEEVSRLSERVGVYQAQAQDAVKLREELEHQKQVAGALTRDLERAREARAETVADLEHRDEQARQLARELAEAQRQAEDASAGAEQVAELRAQIARREQELQDQRDEAARLRIVADSQERQIRELELADRQAATQVVEVAAGDMAPPNIELIDPPLLATRSLQPQIVAPAGMTERELVGRVTAAAGIYTFLVNGKSVAIQPNGLFSTAVPVNGDHPKVELVAVDKLGERSTVAFELIPEVNLRAPGAVVTAPPPLDVDFGPFVALVIGNNDYEHLQDLQTPVSDARRVAEVLATKYGFRTQVLENATRYDILKALNQLRQDLDERSNLVIYYAGHGQMDSTINRGFWLPVDAEPESDANWISTATISDHLTLIPAKHILVVADSCYSGMLTRSSLARLEQGMSAEVRGEWIAKMARKKCRTALTSGGLKPVMDSGGGNHSVFAKALIDVLDANGGVLETQKLFLEVSARVAWAADAVRMDQVPEYAPIQHAGHEAGEFFFVPTS